MPQKHPRESGLGDLIPDLFLILRYDEKNTGKFLLHNEGAKCVNVTLIDIELI